MKLPISVCCLLWCALAFGQPTPPLLGSAGKISGTDWARRVVANGGAMPTASTIAAMETFRVGIIADGLSNKMLSICVFVPDSLTAALTPIWKTQGYDPWRNTNFVSGDLTVEGLKGNGTSKYLDTGVHANVGGAVTSSGSCGLTVLVTESYDNASGVDIGHYDAGPSKPLALAVSGTASAAGSTFFLTRDTILGTYAVGPDWRRSGVVSASSLNSNLAIYAQSPLIAQMLVATQANVTTLPTSSSSDTIFVFARALVATADSFSGKRLSAVAIHDGLTAAETASLSSRLIVLRTALGGGTGDEIVNWAARVVALGGADPSTATKTAMRTFYTGLEAAGFRTNIVVANFYVPDSFDAARMPLIWNAGGEKWTNNAFASSNLTVNGLTGNGTSKSLSTGIVPSAIVTAGFGTASAGMSILINTSPTTGTLDLACGESGHYFAVFNDVNAAWFRCWKFSNTGTDQITGASPSSTGWFSGNRTAANLIKLYQARSNITFTNLATGTGTQTDVAFGQQLVAFAVNFGGSISGWSDHTVSFVSVHSGLTSNQNSNYYNLVSTARVALGGGNP